MRLRATEARQDCGASACIDKYILSAALNNEIDFGGSGSRSGVSGFGSRNGDTTVTSHPIGQYGSDSGSRDVSNCTAGGLDGNAFQVCHSDGDVDDRLYALNFATRCDNQVAAVSWSDYSIRLYDLSRGVSESLRLTGHQDRITGVKFGKTAGECFNTLFSCSEDGLIAVWDLRCKTMAQKFVDPSNGASAFGCLDIGCDDQLLAGGTMQGENSSVLFWDRRASQLLGKYTESHVDDITQLEFHPASKTQLCSGSMDGLLCFYDITKPDEDSALLSVMNVGSAIDKIGFWGRENENLFALTHCQEVALFNIEKAQLLVKYSLYQDLAKAGMSSEYLIDCFSIQPESPNLEELVLISGFHDGRISLHGLSPTKVQKICDLNGSEFGHSCDVRCVTLLNRDRLTSIPKRLLSGGEDGLLCDWHHVNDTSCRSRSFLSSEKHTQGARGRPVRSQNPY